jgi:hypothetical protein
MKRYKRSFFFYIASFILMLPIDLPASDKNYYITIYGATQTREDIWGTLTLPTKFERDYNLLAFAFGKKIGAWRDYLGFELEGQAVKHFGKQSCYEFNGVFVVRWLKFPWDKYLDTSFAVGEGLSLTTEIPELELEQHGKAAKFLNYLMFELAFEVPGTKNWSFVLRAHHRSGVFGLFQDVEGASNALGAGIRYDFH